MATKHFVEKVTFVYKRNKLNSTWMTVLNIWATIRIGRSRQSVHVTGESRVRNTGTSVCTPTCTLQRNGQVFLTVDRSDSDQNSVLTIAVIYLVRNTSFGILPGLRAALRNDRESITDRVRHSSSLQWFHIDSGSHPALYSKDIVTFYSRVKRPKHTDHMRLA